MALLVLPALMALLATRTTMASGSFVPAAAAAEQQVFHLSRSSCARPSVR